MAINFGIANNYNVFVFNNMSLSNTDAEGRVAVGGNAVLSNIVIVPHEQMQEVLFGTIQRL